MTTFIILAVIMCVAAVLAVAVPLWRGASASPDADRREAVLAILRRQAADLEAERAAGSIDEDEYEEARSELKRRVLEEAKTDSAAKSGKSLTATRILAVVCAVLIPASAVFGYLALGRYTAMDPDFIAMMEAQSEQNRGHSQTEITKMLDQMRANLEADPQNANGWFMLARTAASVNRFDESVEAFKRLNALVPNNADIIADMADMMAAANGKVITPEVEALLKKALRIDPNQWKALALLAIQAWDRQQYAQAASYWEHLVEVVPPDFPDVEQIRANISEAKRLAGVSDGIRTGASDAQPQAVSGSFYAEKAKPVPTTGPQDARVVAGTVTLDASLADKVKPDDVVFIYARPVTSKMPVAFRKVKAKELPYNFTLDETMTMAMGAQTLADVKTVVVGARISKTGNFMPQSGDLEGEMKQPVEVGDRGLVVQIRSVHP